MNVLKKLVYMNNITQSIQKKAVIKESADKLIILGILNKETSLRKENLYLVI